MAVPADLPRPLPQVDEHRARLQTERQLAHARLVTTVIGAVNLVVQQFNGPPWTIALAWVGVGLVGLSAVAVLRAVGRDRLTRRTGNAAAWAETLGLGLLLPAAADEHTAFVILMILLMSVLAALRDGRRGLVRALVVGVTAEAVRSGIAIAMVDHTHPEDSIIGIVLAAAVGAVVGHEADLSRARAAQAQQAAHHLELQRQVVLAGIGAHEQDALQRMADRLGAELQAASVTIVLRDEDAPLRVVATTDPSIASRSQPHVLPDGPLDRALNHGEAALASPESLDALSDWLPARGSVSSAPLRRGDAIVGALCIDTPSGTTLDEVDLGMIAQLADQMSLVIEAARSYDREAELAARYRELDRLKTDFIAITSHELRTPLTTVVGVIETMRRRLQELGPEESRRLVEALSRQAGRLSRLVDDLATVSRVDAGTLVTVPRPTDVMAVIGEAVAGLPHVPTEVDAQPDLPTAAVDPDRLLQVLSNLVANGEQHGRGTVHLSVRSLDGAIVVRIWDDGPGIPSPRREEVFERFVRLGQTETHSRGTGLGLAIARELVQAMGGSIAVVDHLDGSAFELRLPATPVSATHA